MNHDSYQPGIGAVTNVRYSQAVVMAPTSGAAAGLHADAAPTVLVPPPVARTSRHQLRSLHAATPRHSPSFRLPLPCA